MVNASLTTGSALSLPSDTYIYSLARLQSSSNSAACIASPSSLVLFDSNSLSAVHHIRKCHTDSVTALVSAGSRFATAGRDGLVKLWDDRAKSESASTTLRGKDGVGFSAIAASCNLIAAGTENTRDGPGDVSVLVWDARSPGTALRTYADSHNDTITALTFHPTAASPLLLSSSTDALLTLFDTSQPDEDDAVAQVFNHSAAVHCASFLAPDEVAAISADEQLGVYQLLTPEAIANEDAVAASTQYGDVRPNLSAGYVVDLLRGASPNEPQTWVASGNLESRSLTLTPLVRQLAAPSTKWMFDHRRAVNLPGAHADEVVRDVLLLPDHNAVLTCGEDGKVRAWSIPSDESATNDQMHIDDQAEDADMHEADPRREEKKRKKRKREKDRFKPY